MPAKNSTLRRQGYAGQASNIQHPTLNGDRLEFRQPADAENPFVQKVTFIATACRVRLKAFYAAFLRCTARRPRKLSGLVPAVGLEPTRPFTVPGF